MEHNIDIMRRSACLFELMIYLSVNNVSVMSGQFPVFLG